MACAAEPASSEAFGRAFGLVLALTVVVVPMFAPYNQVLLAPAILALVRRESSSEETLPALRLAGLTAGALLIWPWIATVGLSLAYVWITPAIRHRVWPMPFYSNFVVPVLIFGVALLNEWTSAEHTLRDGATAE